jgi:mannonate dehydratase
VTAYDHATEEAKGPHPLGPVTEDDLWRNLAYFLDAVLPAAEEHGVDLALHPDDPPISPIRGVARILTSVSALVKVLAMSDSPRHKLTFCQGTIATMGEDIPSAIRLLAPRTAFVHFRDIEGSSDHFVETFCDQGRTDKRAAMTAWLESGYAGYVRTDHVPTLHGETNANPGYGVLGRLHAVGHLQGLREALMTRT